jgi:prepilin-type N-terminal cleavage/methylation domain-containing protein
MNARNTRAFSLAETLITVAVVGVLAAIATATYSNLIGSTQNRKLVSDIDTLNRSVIAHIATGADLSSVQSAEEVLTILKQSFSEASRMPGFSGGKIDERLSFSLQTESEAARNGWRAYWSPADQRFILAKSGPAGIKGFSLDDNAVPKDLAGNTPKTPLLYAENSSWIWDYKDAAPSLNPGPSVVSVGEVADTTPVPPSGPGGLSPASSTPLTSPSFSIASGSFPITSFNLPLTLSNPNPSGSSDLYYSIDFGPWKLYSGPLSVKPGTVVAAQAIAKSDLYTNSARADQTYLALPANLLPPVISPSRTDFGIFTDRTISVTISDLNPNTISKLQYRIGGDPWQDYTAPFNVNRDAYPSGLLVQARSIPTDPNYVASSATLRTLGVQTAAITGTSVGTFSNPTGEKQMETNLVNGVSSDYFEWGKEFKDNSGNKFSRSSLGYNGLGFSKVDPGKRFQIGTLEYFNGTIVSNTGATAVSFAVDLNLAMNGVAAKSTFDFDLELINVENNGKNEWDDADFVRLANPIASQYVTFNGIKFQLQLEFGETSANGISYFDEFHVIENQGASTRLYGTLVEVGTISFNK